MPLITLTSDFGFDSHALARVKGSIYRSLPQATLVDLNHRFNGFNLQQSAYHFRAAYHQFPSNSFHFIFCDLHANPEGRLLYAYENQQHIFCPDNGFMTLLFDDQPVKLFHLPALKKEDHHVQVCEQYLHVLLQLNQRQKPDLLAADVQQIVVRKPKSALLQNDSIEAPVLLIDHVGNVILNLRFHEFEEARKGRSFRIHFMRDEELDCISTQYHDVDPGEKLCRFNSAGFLEIAVNKGSAARLFGFSESSDRSLFYQTVKIFFE